MNIIKTVLQYRNQEASQVLFHHDARRVKDSVAFTRHLIKYEFSRSGLSAMTIQRHMKAISGGFNHASILHSIRIVEAQPYIFAKMLEGIER